MSYNVPRYIFGPLSVRLMDFHTRAVNYHLIQWLCSDFFNEIDLSRDLLAKM